MQYLHIILDELCCPDPSLHVEADVNFNFSLLVCEFYYWYLQKFNLKNCDSIYNILHSHASKCFQSCTERLLKNYSQNGFRDHKPKILKVRRKGTLPELTSSPWIPRTAFPPPTPDLLAWLSTLPVIEHQSWPLSASANEMGQRGTGAEGRRKRGGRPRLHTPAYRKKRPAKSRFHHKCLIIGRNSCLQIMFARISKNIQENFKDIFRIIICTDVVSPNYSTMGFNLYKKLKKISPLKIRE